MPIEPPKSPFATGGQQSLELNAPSARDRWKSDPVEPESKDSPTQLPGFDFEAPEPEVKSLDGAFATWQKNPNPQTSSLLLKAASPHINAAVYRQLQTSDPVVLGKAKALVLNSLPRYDPARSSLPTYIDRQLQPLRRWQAARQSSIRLPDRIRTESAALANAERQLRDENGYEPSTRQLADHTGISAKRIETLRKAQVPTFAASNSMGEDPEGIPNEFGDLATHNDTEAGKAWINLVRHDLSDIDQFILEHTIGLDGAKRMSNKQIAESLRLSPGAISQRKMRIQNMLDKESELNPFG